MANLSIVYSSSFFLLYPIAELLLHNNGLTGGIPDVSENTNLYRLELSNNTLSGGISGNGIFNLENLELLYLDHNQLTGTIPVNFGNNSNLADIFLNDNLFSGPIPNIPDDGVTLLKLRKC